MKKILLLLLLSVESVLGQAGRPPVTTLSGLSDVAITSPTNGQSLIWNAGSTPPKWNNSNTLTDTRISSSTIGGGGPVANFSNATLVNPIGTMIDWSTGLKFPVPVQDSTGANSINANARQLLQNDGTTVAIDYSAGVKFPQLTNTSSTSFLQTDSTGKVIVALASSSIPTGGSIGQVLTKNSPTDYDTIWTSPPGTGTVTSFSAGPLFPLFTTSVTSYTTSPALSFVLQPAAANSFFGNNTGVATAPAFQTIAASNLSNGTTGTGSVVLNNSPTLVGTNTNSNAAAGQVGETVTSALPSTSAVAYTTAQTKNLTSISLTAGDWDVRGSAIFVLTTLPASSAFQLIANISTVTGTIPDDGEAGAGIVTSTATALTGSPGTAIAPRRLSLASTTTVYLVARAPAFGSGTVSVYGFIEARRMR
jgi:hypothetical protein